MANYDPIVPRPQGGSRRATGSMPDPLRRVLYQQMLREELGQTLSGNAEPRSARSWVDLILPVTLIVLLAGLVLGGSYAYSLWQSGAFDRYSSPLRPAADPSWQKQDRQRPPEDLAPAKSEVEEPLPPATAESEAEELPVESISE